MIYKYSFAYQGKLQKFSSDQRMAVYDKASTFMLENGIRFNQGDLLKAIDRQSNVVNSSKKRISLKDAFSGALAALNYIAGKSVSVDEMNRRASICEKCPLRSRISGCTSCGAGRAMTNLANEIRVKKGTQAPIPSSIKDSFCGICSCSLSLMVVTGIEDFYSETSEKNNRRPDVCWLKKTSINYSHE